MSSFLYNKYSNYLKIKYNAKVYKLPVNLPVTCPNRDGLLSTGGCIYCGEAGAGFESLSSSLPVAAQLELDMQKMRELYKAEKFIAYFQNFSNTYLPLDHFKRYIEEAANADIVEISVSTRPDCVSDAYLSALKTICDSHGISATIELGLQTVNYHTLKKINRGHTLAEFIDAVLRIKRYGMETCAHVIVNLPWDNIDDTIETAKIISSLGIEQAKLHALYVLKDTELAQMYENKEFEIISVEEYIERVITFLEYLDPCTTIQRIIGRSPQNASVFANWGMSWWKIHDEIRMIMERDGRFQGKLFHYLNGSAVQKFL